MACDPVGIHGTLAEDPAGTLPAPDPAWICKFLKDPAWILQLGTLSGFHACFIADPAWILEGGMIPCQGFMP